MKQEPGAEKPPTDR